MLALVLSLLPLEIQRGPSSNGADLGSCLTPDQRPVDLRRVELLQGREQILHSGVGRVRVQLDGQRFALEFAEIPDDGKVVGDVGDMVGENEERADVFLTLGRLDGRPVLYWRETYQHRTFRQGLLNISPEALRADWTQVLSPLCEGSGGFSVSH